MIIRKKNTLHELMKYTLSKFQFFVIKISIKVDIYYFKFKIENINFE